MSGFIYRRPDSPYWWVAWHDETGKQRRKSTGREDESLARKALDSILRKVDLARVTRTESDDALTVERFAERWLKDRELRGMDSAKDDRRWLVHALRARVSHDESGAPLGKLALASVKRSDVRTVMAKILKAGTLAPKSQHHVYGTLRVMFNDALADGEISATPCTLKERRKELVKKQDKDPMWRDTAVFTRDELEQLIGHPLIPLRRRVIYAALFLAGMRIGELAARTWADWDRTAHPLTALDIRTSWNRKQKRVKSVKTDRPRIAPVHPALEAILREWEATGWAEMMGRPPRPDDLLVPSSRGHHLRDPNVLINLHSDLRKIGARPRRTHDTRRTFLSLGQADGADREKLKWVTHGPPGDIVGKYTSLPWDTLCAEVARLRVVTPELRSAEAKKKAPSHEDLEPFSECPGRDSNPDQSSPWALPWHAEMPFFREKGHQGRAPSAPQDSSQRNSVTDPSGYERLADREGLSDPPSIH